MIKKEETIFQVKILRDEGGFELVKTELTEYEQSGFEQFLKNYIDVLNDMRKVNFQNNYDVHQEMEGEE